MNKISKIIWSLFSGVLCMVYKGDTAVAASCAIEAYNVNADMRNGWRSSACNSDTVERICRDRGVGSSWVQSTGGYEHCWCKNRASDESGNASATIFCEEYPSSTLYYNCGGGNGGMLTSVNEDVSSVSNALYGGRCPQNATDACFYSTGSKCKNTYSSTGEVLSNLKICCRPCTKVGVNMNVQDPGSGRPPVVTDGGNSLIYDDGSGHVTVYGTAQSGWVISGDGSTGGSGVCKYIAQGAVTDDTGTFVAGNGGSYTCVGK